MTPEERLVKLVTSLCDAITQLAISGSSVFGLTDAQKAIDFADEAKREARIILAASDPKEES
jgi:MinD superfamily P-loop ATPase